ncbi:MAG: hypothetical protein A2W35_06545 [Chloroflexi bacterium RBG_16_57_11]|nr:MAG: hypothetical protein A2W35_06545 [Chloroflexi bacterium RBG_16_57_11]HKZ02396.1 helix-turn-helix transcriptional regulator [Pyrinomonadaceae bacterium]
MSKTRNALRKNFENRAYRRAFVEESIRTGIAAQIAALREQRHLTQTDLAVCMQTTRSWIFRLEDPNQPPPTIQTILRVADALDVAVDVQFLPFSEFIEKAIARRTDI